MQGIDVQDPAVGVAGGGGESMVGTSLLLFMSWLKLNRILGQQVRKKE